LNELYVTEKHGKELVAQGKPLHCKTEVIAIFKTDLSGVEPHNKKAQKLYLANGLTRTKGN
jgi:hypothetical protein